MYRPADGKYRKKSETNEYLKTISTVVLQIIIYTFAVDKTNKL